MEKKKCDLKKCGCRDNSFIFKNDKIGYLYFEIPKCASATLNKSFLNRGEVTNLDNLSLNNYLTFAFVRNPWSRTVSNYIHFCTKQHDIGSLKNKQAEKLFNRSINNIDFTDFVKEIQHINNHHWNPCHYYLPDDLSKVDIIEKLSNFDQTAQKIEAKLNISIARKKHHATNHQHYSSFYTRETREIIKDLYGKDIKLFNFQFKNA